METRIFVVENDLGEVFLVKAHSEEEALKKYRESIREDDIRSEYHNHVEAVEHHNELVAELKTELSPLPIPSYEEFKEGFLNDIWVEGELNLSRDVTPISECGIEAYL